ncbi:hypothetical protein ACFQLX_17085 [Streptomyces polyrhachis]|uniref:Uncharacterized protein n=1 Tax=Streptomyces polyrhachis TaxID=1282885 RepID=A0ABW2GGH2_9ACTN
MSRVRIQSYVRIGAEFQPIQDVAVAYAGLVFFTEPQRICSEYDGADPEIDMLRPWPRAA